MKKWAIIFVALLSVTGCNVREQAKEKNVSQNQALVKEAAAQFMQKGVQSLNEKDVVKAVENFRSAIQVDPSDVQPYVILAEIFMRMKNYSEAISVLESAANAFPEDGSIFYTLSLAHASNGASLPAVLAARRSAELFKAQNNQEGYQNSMLFMQSLIKNEQEKESKEAPLTQNK